MGFLDDDFLLSSATARRLYRSFAETAPVVDFHNHLSAKTLSENRPFRSLTALWLDEDHYKWRAMRAHGIPEERITGWRTARGDGGGADGADGADGPRLHLDRQRFRDWAATVPATPLNPLFAWSHLELRRVFGLEQPISPETADEIFDAVQSQLSDEAQLPQSILRRFNVRAAATTDDPADSLEHHALLQAKGVSIYPTFRPDRAAAISAPRAYDEYLHRLSEAAGLPIRSPQGLLDALESRHLAFHEAGCRASDHGVEALWDLEIDGNDIERIWQRVRAGRPPRRDECRIFETWLLREIARMNVDRGWVSQYHLGPARNVSTRLVKEVGADAGGDAMGDPLSMRDLGGFLNRLELRGTLPRTVIYCIRPGDAAAVASMAGVFNDGSVIARVQLGAAWWFSDTEYGIRSQIRTIAETGLLRHSVGMVTDSRSLLSLTRHEYFRRILCDEIAAEIERGLLPDDDALLAPLIAGVTHQNALDYFRFP